MLPFLKLDKQATYVCIIRTNKFAHGLCSVSYFILELVNKLSVHRLSKQYLIQKLTFIVDHLSIQLLACFLFFASFLFFALITAASLFREVSYFLGNLRKDIPIIRL
jgi:hypothetical protein